MRVRVGTERIRELFGTCAPRASVRGEGRGAAGAAGLPAWEAGRLEVSGIVGNLKTFWVVWARVREEGRMETMILGRVDLSCLVDTCEEMSSRQLPRGGWSPVESSGLDVRICQSSLSVGQ